MRQPRIKPVLFYKDKNLYQLTEDFPFSYKNISFIIKKDFIFDGASIPRMFWTTTGSPFDPRYMLPALVHDYLYRSHQSSKKDTDKLFLDLLKLQEVGFFTRQKMYYAVKFFGKKAWKNRGRDILK